jgi:transcriptional regulator with GAF, ATPase, and Fis domain
MLDCNEIPPDQMASTPRIAALLNRFACDVRDADQLLNKALPAIRDDNRLQALAIAIAERGRWRVIAQAGDGTPPPDLLSDAIDADALRQRDGWAATPLSPRSGSGEVLVLRTEGKALIDEAFAQTLAALMQDALVLVRQRMRDQARIERLEAILSIAGQWNQTNEMESLLTQMAEASTRLLDAERASIFLWDRSNGTLVGRPALGVEGGELRIADNRGVVGQVVQSGEVRRIDEGVGQDEIDRKVDQKLDFETRTVLCVPLRGRSGQLFGAFEMINKRGGNFNSDDEEALVELASHAAIALENTQQYEELLRRRKELTEEAAHQAQLVGVSPTIEALRSTVGRVADTDLAILVLGENGTGKEVVSRMIHYLSKRRDEPFVAVNCAALTETLLESELFGHEKGAFTDAHEARVGKFESASGGTLFLDEIGDLSPSGQAKLLRVLEEKVVVRVGGSVPIHTDTRVIAATNQDLAEMVHERRFREDLFFRLNVVSLECPPLRDRGEDTLLLAEHFLAEFCLRARRQPPRFTAAAKKRMMLHRWPGNVRELRNLMERLAYLLQGDEIDADDLAFILTSGDDGSGLGNLDLPLAEATNRFQADYVRHQIRNSRGNMTEAARRLGLHRSNLYRKMRQLGMDADEG